MEASREADIWLDRLRDRLIAIACRRLPSDSVEDVVQDAMRIVFERGLAERQGETETVDGYPPVAWCFQVLRNVIGNYYQKARTLSRETVLDDALATPSGRTPLEMLESSDLARTIKEAVGLLEEGDPRCGRYLRLLMGGSTPSEIAGDERLKADVLYRRVYRCRAKLRGLLEDKGILV